MAKCDCPSGEFPVGIPRVVISIFTVRYLTTNVTDLITIIFTIEFRVIGSSVLLGADKMKAWLTQFNVSVNNN